MSEDNLEGTQRRAFFHDAVARMIGPLAEYIEQRLDLPPDRPRLRPPGAIEESQLVETCYRCGACVDTCPADAIFALEKSEGDVVGTPAVDPDVSACVVCDGLKCTTVCPSGALLPVLKPSDVRMGLAEVYKPLCVRTRRETCTLCVDRCPLGETAIRFNDDGPPEVVSPGCIGCGVCQLYCPTSPKTIVVRPLWPRARTTG